MIGVDEVGRGAWAGPLVVCAVRLTGTVAGVGDSKKLSKKKREYLYWQIINHADVGLGWVSADEIDDLGLSPSLKQAAAKALIDIGFDDSEEVVVDGSISLFPSLVSETVMIKADGNVPCVSAASVVAKVIRDNRMAELHLQVSDYDFIHNVGYGTAKHASAIEQLGTTQLHRLSFTLPPCVNRS